MRLALLLALLPLAVSAVFVVATKGATYTPTADNALIELNTRDVGHHPVLVGLVSRDGWSHPGPVLFYLLAAPYRLMGSSSIALSVGAIAINAAAIAGMAVVARRRGGLSLMLLTLLGIGLLVRALGSEFMLDPWNPYIPVLAFGLLVFLVWAMTCGETWALPVTAGVGSFCIQTHVGYLPLVAPLVLWGVAWLIWSLARAHRLAALARAGLVTAAVLSVLWLPPLLDEVLHSPGNLTEVVDYFRHSGKSAHTLADGYRVMGAQFGLTPEWIHPAHSPESPRRSTRTPSRCCSSRWRRARSCSGDGEAPMRAGCWPPWAWRWPSVSWPWRARSATSSRTGCAGRGCLPWLRPSSLPGRHGPGWPGSRLESKSGGSSPSPSARLPFSQ